DKPELGAGARPELRLPALRGTVGWHRRAVRGSRQRAANSLLESALYVRSVRLSLLQPVRHPHLAVHRRRGDEVLLRLPALARAPVELAEAEVAVGDEGALAESPQRGIASMSAISRSILLSICRKGHAHFPGAPRDC